MVGSLLSLAALAKARPRARGWTAVQTLAGLAVLVNLLGTKTVSLSQHIRDPPARDGSCEFIYPIGMSVWIWLFLDKPDVRSQCPCGRVGPDE
ncbi:MAG: hypothetical protein RMK16_04810 [Acidobacteriota bacterium]|nr:hypothetical protein [Acidobacteriota bacterium]